MRTKASAPPRANGQQKNATPVTNAPARGAPPAQMPAGKQEHVTVLNSDSTVPDADGTFRDANGELQTNTRANDGTYTGSVVTEEDLAKEGGDPIRRFEVLETKVVSTGSGVHGSGYRTKMNAGKVIDSLNFDVELLKKQGLKLRELGPEEQVA